MEFIRGPMILSPAQGGSAVKVAINQQGDRTTWTAGEDADGSGCILVIEGSAGHEEMHGILDSGIAWMNLRANDKITPNAVANVITANFPGAVNQHLDAYVNALEAYEKAKPGGISVPEGLSIGLALLPAVADHLPHNGVTDAIRAILSGVGVKF